MPVVEVEGYPSFEVEPDTTLLSACEDHGVPMDSACGGFAACNSCRVVVIAPSGGLSPKVDEEDAFLDHDDQRLGCQARVVGAVRVRLDPGM